MQWPRPKRRKAPVQGRDIRFLESRGLSLLPATHNMRGTAFLSIICVLLCGRCRCRWRRWGCCGRCRWGRLLFRRRSRGRSRGFLLLARRKHGNREYRYCHQNCESLHFLPPLSLVFFYQGDCLLIIDPEAIYVNKQKFFSAQSKILHIINKKAYLVSKKNSLGPYKNNPWNSRG